MAWRQWFNVSASFVVHHFSSLFFFHWLCSFLKWPPAFSLWISHRQFRFFSVQIGHVGSAGFTALVEFSLFFAQNPSANDVSARNFTGFYRVIPNWTVAPMESISRVQKWNWDELRFRSRWIRTRLFLFFLEKSNWVINGAIDDDFIGYWRPVAKRNRAVASTAEQSESGDFRLVFSFIRLVSRCIRIEIKGWKTR